MNEKRSNAILPFPKELAIGDGDEAPEYNSETNFDDRETLKNRSTKNQRLPRGNKFILTSTMSRQQKRNWLDLPSKVTANILNRIGIVDILENVEKVCTAWLEICKDPAMWRVIYLNTPRDSSTNLLVINTCKLAVDRSQGQLVDLTLGYAYNADLLLYVAQRSSELRRLELSSGRVCKSLTTDALKKFPLLEELNLYSIKISKEDIKTIGRYCPKLKTLKANRRASKLGGGDAFLGSAFINLRAIIKGFGKNFDVLSVNELAIAIGHYLPALRHLELIGNKMTNTGLQAILDKCHHLETLDLRECYYVDLKGDLGKQCSKQIKCLKLPNDSVEDYPYISANEFSETDLYKEFTSPPFVFKAGSSKSEPCDMYLYR